MVDFHEYTKLYLDSWSDPEIRWLLSTVPSVMIFDDHEIIDDWNSSAGWRADDHPADRWWSQRIQAGLASYWVYQHLGNLAPGALAEDPIYAAVTSTGRRHRDPRRVRRRAERERGSLPLELRARHRPHPRWWCWTTGPGASSRPAGGRSMLPDAEWEWFHAVVQGDYDHLVVGSSLPWLMPPAIHYLEAISERLADSPRGRWPRLGRADPARRWTWSTGPSFGSSFDALSVAARPDRRPGASAAGHDQRALRATCTIRTRPARSTAPRSPARCTS